MLANYVVNGTEGPDDFHFIFLNVDPDGGYSFSQAWDTVVQWLNTRTSAEKMWIPKHCWECEARPEMADGPVPRQRCDWRRPPLSGQ